MIYLSKPLIGKEEEEAVRQVLTSGFIVQGPKVAQLEKEMAKLCGTKYAVAVNTGTAALHAALYSLSIKPGDEIITTPFTFVATVNSILMIGAKPIFVDIKEDTYNLDPAKIEAAITKKTKAILVVNLYGQPADYDEIKKISKKHKLFIVEDAAQSINAQYKKRKSGNLGDIGCFSFYATKNIMSGEGGMITTNSKKIYERVRLFRHHGQDEQKRYEYTDLGYNYRMTDIHASIALEQLKRIDDLTERRRRIAGIYTQSLQNIHGIVTPQTKKNSIHVYHQYTIKILKDFKKNRDAFKKYLADKGIQSGIYYPMPLHKSKHLRDIVNRNEKFPIAEKAAKEVLSIPVHPLLTDKEVAHVINTILSL